MMKEKGEKGGAKGRNGEEASIAIKISIKPSHVRIRLCFKATIAIPDELKAD